MRTERAAVPEGKAETLDGRRRLAALGADVGAALTECGTLPSILQRCAEAIVRHLDAAFARIWTFEDATAMLELQASAGMYTHTNGAHGRIPLGQLKIGRIAQDRRAHLTNRVIGDPQIPDQDWARREGMVAFAGYPLILDDRLVGVMAMFARQPLDEATLDALASVARSIALGIVRKRAEEQLGTTLRHLEDIMEAIPDMICTLDRDARVTRWNRKTETITGFSTEDLAGRSITDLAPEAERSHVAEKIQAAFANGYAEWEGHVRCRTGIEVPIHWAVAPLKDGEGRVTGLAGAGRDITERREADRRLAQLSDRLLRLKEDEERRISRELHDSTAQNLAALGMNLAILEKASRSWSAKTRAALSESVMLADRCLREVRTISYLLHPPLLDEMGLPSAVRWYTAGFSQRSGVRVDLEIAQDIGRLPPETELALFRIVQECLTNVHRHAKSPVVTIVMRRDGEFVAFEARDAGKGFPESMNGTGRGSIEGVGVGIMGMRERVRLLGGSMTIRSDRSGTNVEIRLPLGATRAPETPGGA